MATVLKAIDTTDKSLTETKSRSEREHLSASKVKISDLSERAQLIFRVTDRDGLKFLPDDHLNTIRHGHTPAMFAAQYNDMDVVKELLQYPDLEIHHIVPSKIGSNHNSGIGHGQNLLGICIHYCGGENSELCYNIIKILVEKDKKTAVEFIVQGYPHKGLNYFQCAAMSGNVAVIKLLQPLGFDIHAETPDAEDGNNVVHLAVINGNVDAVAYFKSQGVNINEKNARGWTPLQIVQDIVRYRALDFSNAYITPDFPVKVKQGMIALLSPAVALVAFERDKEKSTDSTSEGPAVDDSARVSSSALSPSILSSSK